MTANNAQNDSFKRIFLYTFHLFKESFKIKRGRVWHPLLNIDKL